MLQVFTEFCKEISVHANKWRIGSRKIRTWKVRAKISIISKTDKVYLGIGYRKLKIPDKWCKNKHHYKPWHKIRVYRVSTIFHGKILKIVQEIIHWYSIPPSLITSYCIWIHRIETYGLTTKWKQGTNQNYVVQTSCQILQEAPEVCLAKDILKVWIPYLWPRWAVNNIMEVNRSPRVRDQKPPQSSARIIT